MWIMCAFSGSETTKEYIKMPYRLQLEIIQHSETDVRVIINDVGKTRRVQFRSYEKALCYVLSELHGGRLSVLNGIAYDV
jgi:hypothetical protein